jgi:hypothetical protein
VTIHADQASLTIAYWYTGDRARQTIREALGYLAVIEQETGWITFDPQLGRRLDLRGDFNEVVSAYEAGSRCVEELARKRSPSSEGPPAKPELRPWAATSRHQWLPVRAERDTHSGTVTAGPVARSGRRGCRAYLARPDAT